MSRRRQREEDDDDYQFEEEPTDSRGVSRNKRQRRESPAVLPENDLEDASQNAILRSRNENDETMNKMAKAFVRSLMGLEFKYQVISKTMINNVYDAEKVTRKTVNWNSVLPRIQSSLNNAFGMELKPLIHKRNSDVNEVEQANVLDPKKKKKPATQDVDYILTSSVPDHLKEVMFSTIQKNEMVKQGKHTDLIESLRSLPASKVSIPKPGTEIVEHGVKMLVISILALSEGTMIKEQLFGILSKKFGINVTENTKIKQLNNMNMSEFLDYLSKQEYINQISIKNSNAGETNSRGNNRLRKTTDTNNNLVQVSIGRRLKTELPMNMFLGMLQEIYGSEWNDETLKSALFTLNGIYGTTNSE